MHGQKTIKKKHWCNETKTNEMLWPNRVLDTQQFDQTTSERMYNHNVDIMKENAILYCRPLWAAKIRDTLENKNEDPCLRYLTPRSHIWKMYTATCRLHHSVSGHPSAPWADSKPLCSHLRQLRIQHLLPAPFWSKQLLVTMPKQ